MTHLDDVAIHRWVDGELTPGEGARATDHLGACPACREAVAEARIRIPETDALLAALDHRVPDVDVGALVARARRPGAGSGRAIGRGARRHLGRAAGIALASAVGFAAAWAAPGSPLPGWWGALRGAPGETAGASPPAVVAPDEVPGPGAAPTSGIAVDPGASLVVTVTGATGGRQLLVRLVDDGRVQVRATGGEVGYTSGVGRLGVDVVRPAQLEIDVPRQAPRVEIVAGGTRLLLGAQADEGPGPWRVDLGG